MCKQHGFERSDKWYEHTPKKVEDNENFKLLWDVSIQTHKKLDHNRPDIVFVDKQNKNCLIIDIACPGDRRVDIKQEEKINKYLDLAIEIKELWKMKRVKVVPVVYRSTRYYSEETGGLPEKHKCWDRAGSTAKNSLVGIRKDPPKSP